MHALRIVGLAGLLIVGLAGCLRVAADLSIDGDAVNGTLVTALDRDASRQLRLDPDDLFAEQTGGLASLAGVTTEPYQDQDWVGSRMVFDQVRIDELNQLSDGNPDGLRIIRQSGRYEFSLVMDFSLLAEDQLATPAAPGVDLAALLETFDVAVSVTFPGEVTRHNGSLSGTTVTWHPPPGERTELRAIALAPGTEATAEPAPTGEAAPSAVAADGGVASSGWWPAFGLLVAVAAGSGLVAGLFLVNRRNRSADGGVE